jgi:hypothetical protein
MNQIQSSLATTPAQLRSSTRAAKALARYRRHHRTSATRAYGKPEKCEGCAKNSEKLLARPQPVRCRTAIPLRGGRALRSVVLLLVSADPERMGGCERWLMSTLPDFSVSQFAKTTMDSLTATAHACLDKEVADLTDDERFALLALFSCQLCWTPSGVRVRNPVGIIKIAGKDGRHPIRQGGATRDQRAAFTPASEGNRACDADGGDRDPMPCEPFREGTESAMSAEIIGNGSDYRYLTNMAGTTPSRNHRLFKKKLVGTPRFELGTPCTPCSLKLHGYEII